MKTGSLDEGARQMIEICLGVNSDEKMVIVAEESKSSIVAAIVDAASKITDRIDIFYLESFGKRPLSKIPDEILASLKDSDVSLMILDKMKGELDTIRKPLKQLGLKYGRHANCPGITTEIMETGMSVDHRKLQTFSKKVFDLVSKCRNISVMSDNGTDLRFKIDLKYTWMNSDGNYTKTPQTGTNLPGSEVFTYPASVDGIAVIDGILGDYFTKKYGFLNKTPLTLQIKEGRVIDVKCLNEELKNDFEAYIHTDQNSGRIGELGIGTNYMLVGLIGVMLQDEKFPGVHIAVGHGFSYWTGCPYDSAVHCDGIILKTTILVDGQKIMERGRYLI